MDGKLYKTLVEIAIPLYSGDDPSHDFSHIHRVLRNAEAIAQTETGVDMDILVPAVLFHDAVTYPKNDPRNKNSTYESADKAEELLRTLVNYPHDKIQAVKECIVRTSFSKGLPAETIEQKILQDADMLEATGAVSIMRTFTSGEIMKRLLYDTKDPFAENRELDEYSYSLDLFYTRLLRVLERMNTEKGKELAQQRTKFLQSFLDELRREINL